jgi:hypothetical protein
MLKKVTRVKIKNVARMPVVTFLSVFEVPMPLRVMIAQIACWCVYCEMRRFGQEKTLGDKPRVGGLEGD